MLRCRKYVHVSTVTALQYTKGCGKSSAVTGSKKLFQKKIRSIQTVRWQRGEKCWSEVLWYDESVIAGLDLSQSGCFKDTSHFCCGQSLRFEIKDDVEGHVRSSDLWESVWNESLWVVCWMRVKETTEREIERDRGNESDTDVSRSDFIGCHGRRFSTPRSVHSAFFILFLSIQEIKKLQCGRTGV